MSYLASRAAAYGGAARLIGARPLAWMGLVASSGCLLAVLLLAALAAWNLRPLVGRAGPQATVFVSPSATPSDVGALRQTLARLEHAGAVRFVGRDAALADIVHRAPLAASALSDLKDNPLPDAFVVSFEAGAEPEAIEASLAAVRRANAVDGVQADLGWYRKLFALARAGRRIALPLAVVAALLAAGWWWIASTAWVRIDAAETRLLWLLGAEDRSIRRPSVFAGALTALASALVGVALAWAAARGWGPVVGDWLRQYAVAEDWQWSLPPPWVAGVVVVAATTLGALAAGLRSAVALSGVRSQGYVGW